MEVSSSDNGGSRVRSLLDFIENSNLGTEKVDFLEVDVG